MGSNISMVIRHLSMRCIYLFFCFLVLTRFSAEANNIQLKGKMNVTEVKNGVATLEFKMSWENSWRDSYNWDAAWIILKYRTASDVAKAWYPLKLQKDGNMVDGGFTCRVSITKTDTAGVLVHRSVRGNGTSEVSCSFKWPLPAGLTGMTQKDFDENKIFFLVQGVEMVYIPNGPYYLGDGESVKTFKRGYRRIIPAEDDIIGTDASFSYDMIPHYYKNAVPSAAANRVNNSVWADLCSHISHTSNVDHGTAATVNNSWIVDFKVRKTIRTFGVSGISSGASWTHAPAVDWLFQGSNDNTMWDTLWIGGPEYYTHDVISYPVQHGIRVTKPDAYRYYRIFVPKTNSTSGMMLVNIAMSERDIFRDIDMKVPESAASLKVIPAVKDIIGTDASFSYDMIPHYYKNAVPSAAANRVNNSVWADLCSHISHTSNVDHGTAATVNNSWIVDFKVRKTIRTFGVSGISSGASWTHAPAVDWLFQGSNDNVKWDTLWTGGPEYYTHDLISYPVQHGIRVTKPDAYRYYRIFIPKINSTSGMMLANIAMSEEDLFRYATDSYLVENDNKITLGTGLSDLYANDGTTWTGELPAVYPKGYKGFYVMKYEVSQEQYVRFLNALTLVQQQSLIPGLTTLNKGEFVFGSKTEPTNRNGIIVSVPTDGTKPAVFDHNLNKNDVYGEDGDGKCLACNFMSINDMLAYCSWAGLRPMSELEYEKACRRPYPDLPVEREFAWNTAIVPTKVTAVTNGGARSESTTVGNANYGSGMTDLGPVRCGLFATPSSTQALAGASFWGVMEMSGNLGELCANVKHTAFTSSTQGKGNFDLAMWGTTPAHFGLRGGGFTSNASALGVSDRSTDSLTDLTTRTNSVGFRGVFCLDTNWVKIDAGAITADKSSVCSGDPLNLSGTAATLSDGADLSFVYMWYVKTDSGHYELIPDEMGATLKYDDFIKTATSKLKYTFKRKALCALGEAVSNEVTVSAINSQIKLSADTILVGVCGKPFRVEVLTIRDVNVDFSWTYNGNEIDTGRVYVPQLAKLGEVTGSYNRVICEADMEGCRQNISVVVDYSKMETLIASRFNTANCGQKVWDERDGQCYTTVNIPGTGGRPDQCWFSQNLNTGVRAAGADYNTHAAAGIQKICYGDDEKNCEKYGGLYSWDEMVNGEKANTIKYESGLAGAIQGICPDGWHVPSDAEWQTLEMNLGMAAGAATGQVGAINWRGTDQGTQLKMPGTFEVTVWCTGADCNKSGFNGLPGGRRTPSGGSCSQLGTDIYWWSSTKYNSTDSWVRSLNAGYATIYRNNNYSTAYGMSVRCVKKQEVASTAVTLANCGEVTVKDTREAVVQYYSTVKIPGTGGRPDQCWFGNNMNIGTVALGSDYSTHTTAGIQKICYSDDEKNCDKYGGLYNWDEAVNAEKAGAIKYVSGTSGAIQGICPDGWHMPSDVEFKTLEMNLGMTQAEVDKTDVWRGTDQGTQMKMPGTFEGTNWCAGADCNKSGFNALPSGQRYYTGGSWKNLGSATLWWSSSVSSATGAWFRRIDNSMFTVYRDRPVKSHGLSVRCIKN